MSLWRTAEQSLWYSSAHLLHCNFYLFIKSSKTLTCSFWLPHSVLHAWLGRGEKHDSFHISTIYGKYIVGVRARRDGCHLLVNCWISLISPLQSSNIITFVLMEREKQQLIHTYMYMKYFSDSERGNRCASLTHLSVVDFWGDVVVVCTLQVKRRYLFITGSV